VNMRVLELWDRWWFWKRWKICGYLSCGIVGGSGSVERCGREERIFCFESLKAG
jgi:hypothetical protein